MNELDELLDHYFSLGVAEGKEGRNHDTPTGEAQATLDLIASKIERLRALATQDHQGSEVGIKAMEWTDRLNCNHINKPNAEGTYQMLEATVLGLWYGIIVKQDFVYLSCPGLRGLDVNGIKFTSIEDAKIVAQADCEQAIKAALAHQPLSVPAGWQLVPIEPTKAMTEASYCISYRDDGAEHWASMLAAAPTVGVTEE